MNKLAEELKAYFSAQFLSGNFDGFEDYYTYSTLTSGTEGEAMSLERIREVIDKFFLKKESLKP